MAFRPLPCAVLLRSTGRQSPRIAIAEPLLVAPLSVNTQPNTRGSEEYIRRPFAPLLRMVQFVRSNGGALSKRMSDRKPPAAEPADSTMQFSMMQFVLATE